MLPLLLACAADEGAPSPPVDYTAAGPWSAGRHTTSVESEGRTLEVEVWYPTDTAAVEGPITDFLSGDQEETYDELLAAAPTDCPSRTMHATLDAPAADGAWPLVGMSHCHGCTRFSTTVVAETLASYGFVVVAPDHDGDTLWDSLAGTLANLDTDELAVRAADLDAAMDADLDLDVDDSRVGVFGHSFGAVTAGVVAQERAVPAMFVGAPPENPLLPGVTVADLAGPLLFEELAEDHSVGAAGNLLIENNDAEATAESWLVDLADAGHWSPSDLVGLTEDFMPGCGEDTRQEDGSAFTYVDPAEARAQTASLAAAFFDCALNGAEDGRGFLDGRI